MTDLQVGVENEDVLDAQDRLRFLGYYDGQINGHFDSATEAAVVQFQQAAGVAQTGTLDEYGLQHLREWADHYHYGSGATHADYGHGTHHGRGEHHGHGHHGTQHTAEQVQDEWAILQARASGAETVQYDGEPAVEGHGQHRNFHDHLAQTLRNASTRALTHATANDQAVALTCKLFKTQYAMPKIRELEHKITYEDLGKQITRSLMDLAGIRVCGQIGNVTAKWFAEQISTGTARKTSAAVKSMMSTESAAKHLTDAFEQMMAEAELAVAQYHEAVAEVMQHALDPVLARLNAHHDLTEDQQWVARFYDITDSDLDAAIEEVFAIPGPATRKEMEVAVYQKLVEDFEAMYIRYSESSRLFPERRDAHEAYEWDPERRAHKEAQAAGEHFREQIE